MALIVETGSGLEDGESYCSVAFADDWLSRNGYDNYAATPWSDASEGDKEIALRRATRWIDNRYRSRWSGRRYGVDQALDWPRSYAEDHEGYYFNSTEMPTRLVQATALLASIALREDIEPNVEVNAGIRSISQKAGPFSETTVYNGSAAPVPTYREVEMMLRSLIASPGRIERG